MFPCVFYIVGVNEPTAWLISGIRKAFACFEPKLVEGDKTGKGVLRLKAENPDTLVLKNHPNILLYI